MLWLHIVTCEACVHRLTASNLDFTLVYSLFVIHVFEVPFAVEKFIVKLLHL